MGTIGIKQAANLTGRDSTTVLRWAAADSSLGTQDESGQWHINLRRLVEVLETRARTEQARLDHARAGLKALEGLV